MQIFHIAVEKNIMHAQLWDKFVISLGIIALGYCTTMVCVGRLTGGGGCRGELRSPTVLPLLNFCWVSGESLRATSFLGLGSLMCWTASSSARAVFFILASTCVSWEDCSRLGDVSEGALLCLRVPPSPTLFFYKESDINLIALLSLVKN